VPTTALGSLHWKLDLDLGIRILRKEATLYFDWDLLPDTEFKWELRAFEQMLDAMSDAPSIEHLPTLQPAYLMLLEKARDIAKNLLRCGSVDGCRNIMVVIDYLATKANALAEAINITSARKVTGYNPALN